MPRRKKVSKKVNMKAPVVGELVLSDSDEKMKEMIKEEPKEIVYNFYDCPVTVNNYNAK